ncbi:MAG: imidazolonepropionase [Bacteroidales bacterium]|nr:imidazolonepropionase [Bacteroidales bacterium]
MENILIINIKQLIQAGEEITLKRGGQMKDLNIIENAYLFIEGELISDYGRMDQMPQALYEKIELGKDPHSGIRVIDAAGKMVFPSFCDSHTHLVYAGSREQEFVDKINGLSYQEIAARGGGILNSAQLLGNTSEDDLYRSALERVQEIMLSGTGAVEIKSGYGLTPENELKMLRVVRRLSQNIPLTVKATFLGAHAFPAKYASDKNGYVEEIINTMIPMIASEGLAEYIDVFCEEGFFSVEDTDRILNAGLKYGLQAKVHANQMGVSGGVQVGVKYDAISVDHLESVGEEEFEALKNSQTIATMLPGATFFLNMQYSPARKFIENDIPLALATNYNPGSCPSGSMQFQMALACIAMKLTPEETINACTINGAYAMGVEETLGSITKGKIANLFITKAISSYSFIPYAFTTPYIDTIILKGKLIN